VSLERSGRAWSAQASPGGLATALRSVAQRREFTWIGYPGTEVPEEEHDDVRELLADTGAAPVFLDDEVFSGFYEEFANRVLWPLFHGLSGPRRFDQRAWEHYRHVNQLFADAIAARVRPGDTVWVHDYQLMLVPQMLREQGLDCSIGFFLHIPFPSSDVYRTLPTREEVIGGVLGADLIGFHTYEYVSNFRSSVLRVLGIASEPETVSVSTHDARLGVLPIGIDPTHIAELCAEPGAVSELESLRETYAGQKVILGVDRLDPSKGLPEKLLAYEELLETHPELHGKVSLIQIAAPSRTGVIEYQALQREIDELAGRINGTYGTLTWVPLQYINQHVSQRRLTALYRLADVMLVTPVRDGMNLVCLEYIAARGDDPGALVLSEFAGASSCLSGAALVNPHNTRQVASVLADALISGDSHEAFEHMSEFVRTNTAIAWARSFLEQLESSTAEARQRTRRLRFDRSPARELVDGARRPLILLDYDGTLRPYTTLPEQARPNAEIRGLLRDLAGFGVVYVVSGRPAAVLDEWLGDLPIGLVCEHGLAIKHLGQDWVMSEELDTSPLTEQVEPVFRDFTARTPGSKIERKRASIAWHYRAADPKFGAWRAKALRALLESRLAAQPYTVLPGSKVVEVRHVNMTKGRAATHLLELHGGTDLVICIGDDRTDEDMFEAVMHSSREHHIVCRVGSSHTLAPYTVPSSAAIVAELTRLVELWRASRD
jgi:trehalose 6-phosphate synthase/phosphatase